MTRIYLNKISTNSSLTVNRRIGIFGGVNMASSKEYLDFILGQLSGLEDITYRAMMGASYITKVKLLVEYMMIDCL